LQHDGRANFTPENLAAKEHFDASGPSCSNLRDRDVRADPPLKEESDPDLAGQASVAAWIDEKSGTTNVALSPTPEVTMILTLQTTEHLELLILNHAHEIEVSHEHVLSFRNYIIHLGNDIAMSLDLIMHVSTMS
jgi:hypothetical protein